MGSSISSVGDMFGLDCFTGGLGDLIVDIAAGNLGDSVAVLNLNGDKLDLGVINTVLGGNLTTSMLYSSFDRVGNSMGSNWSNMSNWGCKRSSSKRGSIRMGSKELRISFSLSIGLTLSNVMSRSNNRSRSITDGVNNFLADLLVLNLFSLNSLSGADILGSRDTGLCHKNLHISLTVGSRDSKRGSNRGSIRMSKELRVSLGISLRFGCCTSKGKKARDSKYFHHVEIVRYFPRWLVELKYRTIST